MIDQVRLLLLSPEIIVQTWRSARKSIKGLTESEVSNALQAFDPLWKSCFLPSSSALLSCWSSAWMSWSTESTSSSESRASLPSSAS